MARETDHHDREAWASVAPPGRYGLLLLVLISTYLLSAFVSSRWVGALQVLLFTVVAALALRNSPASRRIVRLGLAAALASLPVMVTVTVTSGTGTGIANIWKGGLMLFAVVAIVYRVFSSGAVTLQSIYGAVSAYLVIGLMFAAFFAAIDHLGGGHFFTNRRPATTQTFQYFSFTTLSTLGYGDFTAAGDGGRAVAVLEALTGQVFLATLVARLVAAYRPHGERDSG